MKKKLSHPTTTINKYIKFYKNDKKLTDQLHKLSSGSNL